MKLSELNARVEELQGRRDALHDQLHEHLADESMPVGEHKAKEREIRDAVKAVMQECYPMEVVRAKSGKLFAGKKLADAELAEYERCVAITGEITIG